MTDVIRVALVDGKCQAALAKTIYKGSDNTSGEGGLDASGKRTPPAPFGSDVPPVGDAGFVLTALSGPGTMSSAMPSSGSAAPVPPPTDPPKTADPHGGGGCAGCSVAEPSSIHLGIGAAGLLALALGWRRVRRHR